MKYVLMRTPMLGTTGSKYKPENCMLIKFLPNGMAFSWE
jgi:hypothetical protein